MTKNPQRVGRGRVGRVFDSLRRFRFPFRSRRELEADVDAEIQFHLESRVRDLETSGLDPKQAVRRARREFGDVEGTSRELKRRAQSNEDGRQRRMVLEEVVRDLRYSIRTLLRTPGFTLTAVLVLALGIGSNATMFGLVNLLLMRPMKIENPGQLRGVYTEDVERPGSYRAFSHEEFETLSSATDIFRHVGAHNITIAGWTEGDVTRRLLTGIASTSYFETLGEGLTLGRLFAAEEERPGAEIPVAVLSWEFYRKLGGTEDLLGTQIRLAGLDVTIVGVASRGFTGTTALFSPDLWLPLGMFAVAQGGPAGRSNVDLNDPATTTLMLVARVEEDVAESVLDARLAALSSGLSERAADGVERQLSISALPRLSMSTDPSDDGFVLAPAILMMAMAAVVLLIACLNLANMLLARGAGRKAEMAMRVALGGSRARLVRQLLSEGLLLSLAGGALGLLISVWASKVLFSSLGALLPMGLSLHVDLTPDVRMLGATLVFCLVATLIFGLAPALRVTGTQLVPGLRADSAQSSARSGWVPSMRSISLVAQIALSLVLLVAGGLFVSNALRVAEQTPGFALERGVLIELDPSLVGYDELRTKGTYERVVDALAQVPEVESVGLASLVPFGAVTSNTRVAPAGVPYDDLDSGSVVYTIISSDYFASLGLPVLEGRELTREESFGFELDRRPVAVIDEPLAKRLWPEGGSAIGKFIDIARFPEGTEPFEIVGVVPGLRQQLWQASDSPHVYVGYATQFASSMNVHVRLRPGQEGREAATLGTLREAIRSVDASLPILSLQSLGDFRDDGIFVWAVRAAAQAFSLLGILALFLAGVGLYGVKSFLFARRTREIGVRMALGATRADVLRLMLREGAVVTLVGLGLGLILSLAVVEILRSAFFGMATDAPLVYVVATATLAFAALLATYVPSRRATRVAPTTALREG